MKAGFDIAPPPARVARRPFPTTRLGSHGGFTLLEVLISTAILALGLSTIFGSSVFASRNTMHARMITNAGLLARCRMTEAETYLAVNQLPDTDQTLTDPPDTSVSSERCCDEPFTCTARVEKIELPQPADIQTGAGDRMLGGAANAAQGLSFGSYAPGGDGGAGAVSQLASAFGALSGGGMGPASIGSGAAGALGGGGGLAGAGAPSLQSMATQLLASIYPTVKPMLEGAIRKLTVNVSWREGSRTYSFDVIEYVTNPGQSMLSGDLLNQLTGGPPGSQPGTAGSGQNSAPTPANATPAAPGQH